MFDFAPHRGRRVLFSGALLLVILLVVLSPTEVAAQSVNCSGVSAWAANIPCSVGQLVTCSGVEYKCQQAHTSSSSGSSDTRWNSGA